MDDRVDVDEVKAIIEALYRLASHLEPTPGGSRDDAAGGVDDSPLVEIRRLTGLLQMRLHTPGLEHTMTSGRELLSVMSAMKTASEPELHELGDRVQRIVQQDPGSQMSLVVQARLAMMTGNFKTAIEALLKARRLKPSDPTLRVLLAAMLWRDGRSTEAIEELEACALENPAHVPCYSSLATILAANGDSARAITMLERGIAAARESWDRAVLYAELGSLKLETEDREGARSAWEAAIRESNDPALKSGLQRRIAAL